MSVVQKTSEKVTNFRQAARKSETEKNRSQSTRLNARILNTMQKYEYVRHKI